MIDHLKHMAKVRPAGLDRDAAQWALTELARRESGWAQAFKAGIYHQDNAKALTIVCQKLRTALNVLRPFPLVVEPVAAALIAEADAALAGQISAAAVMDDNRTEA